MSVWNERKPPPFPSYSLPGSPGYEAAKQDVASERRLAAKRHISAIKKISVTAMRRERWAKMSRMKAWPDDAAPPPPVQISVPKLDWSILLASPYLPEDGEQQRTKKILPGMYKPGAKPQAFSPQDCGPPLGAPQGLSGMKVDWDSGEILHRRDITPEITERFQIFRLRGEK